MKKVALILGFLVVSFGAFTQKESDAFLLFEYIRVGVVLCFQGL